MVCYIRKYVIILGDVSPASPAGLTPVSHGLNALTITSPGHYHVEEPSTITLSPDSINIVSVLLIPFGISAVVNLVANLGADVCLHGCRHHDSLGYVAALSCDKF